MSAFIDFVINEKFAALIQAVGSVIAIVVAIALSKQQHRSAMMLHYLEKSDRRAEKYEAIRAIVEEAADCYTNAVAALKGNDYQNWIQFGYFEKTYRDFNRILGEISPLELPDYSSARSLLKTRELFEAMSWNLKTAVETGNHFENDFNYAIDCLEHNLFELNQLSDTAYTGTEPESALVS